MSQLVAAIHDAACPLNNDNNTADKTYPTDTIHIHLLPMVPIQSPKRRPPRLLVTFGANYHALSLLSKDRVEDAVVDRVEQVGWVLFDSRLKSPAVDRRGGAGGSSVPQRQHGGRRWCVRSDPWFVTRYCGPGMPHRSLWPTAPRDIGVLSCRCSG